MTTNDDRARRVLVIHGPNALTGDRPDRDRIDDDARAEIAALVRMRAAQVDLVADFVDASAEAEAVAAVGDLDDDVAGVILNPGALAGYSQLLGETVASASAPVVEVRLSNPDGGEPWRRRSIVGPAATATLAGCGSMGYVFAVDAVAGFGRL